MTIYFLIVVPEIFAAAPVVATLVVVLVSAELIAAEVVASVVVDHFAVSVLVADTAEIAALNYKYWIRTLPHLLRTFSLFI